jgi:hypothetical protein
VPISGYDLYSVVNPPAVVVPQQSGSAADAQTCRATGFGGPIFSAFPDPFVINNAPTRSQCAHGGWQAFGFSDRQQCDALVENSARESCLAERASIGPPAFQAKYGIGPRHRNAMRRCIRIAGGG